MQDRLKFRCWDKERCEYIPIEDNQDYSLQVNLNTGEIYHGLTPDDLEDCYYRKLPTDDLVFEQCTGFKDKNGRLIYEGDILKSVYGDIFYFVWSAGAFWAKDLKREILAQDGAFYYENSEIIGNIHENPELIGGAE